MSIYQFTYIADSQGFKDDLVWFSILEEGKWKFENLPFVSGIGSAGIPCDHNLMYSLY